MPRPDALTLKQMRAFAAVCETGSISKAAEQLGLTAPAVHTQLKSLESSMNSKLLDRSRTNEMAPTEAGLAMLKAHQKVSAALFHAAEEIRAMNAGLRGFVRLGVVSTAKYFAPKLLAALQSELPQVSIELVVGNRQAIIDALSNERLDLAVMGRPPRLTHDSEDRLGSNPHVLVCPPKHPFAQGGFSSDVLLAERFILREAGSGTRILAERFLDGVGGGRAYASMVMDSNETIKQAVMAGLGIAILSAHTVVDELQDQRLAVVRHAGLPINRTWYLISARDDQRSAATEKVRDLTIGICRTMLQSDELTRLID